MYTHRILAGLAILTVGLLGQSCSSDSTEPGPVATAVALVSGDAQTGTVGTALPNPIIVKVTDQHGDAMANVQVDFAVTAGGGSVGSGSASTNAQGIASTVWVLGSTAGGGNQGVTATVSGLTGSPVPFTASASAGAAAQLTILSGDRQTAEVGSEVGQVPTVVVQDGLSNPVAGVVVSWSVTYGGGAVGAPTSVTDASGNASMAWTLGPDVWGDSQALRASASGGAQAVFTATATLTAGTLEVYAGDNQSASAGSAVAVQPSVLVKTPGANGVPVENVAILWEVTAGGGAVSPPYSYTNAFGIATVGWIVGGTPGSSNQGLSATVINPSGWTGTPVAFVASAGPPAFSLTKLSGEGQSGPVYLPLAQPFVVVLTDSTGDPVAGVSVTWGFLFDNPPLWGEPSLSAYSTTTNASGQASTILTQGGWVGQERVWARTQQVGIQQDSVVFTAVVEPAEAAFLKVSSGDGQIGPVGTLLPAPLVVRVEDAYGNFNPGVTVQWSAAAGSGSVAVSTSQTDSSGLAWNAWTLGTTPGTNNQFATATVAGLSGSPVTFSASATAGP